MAGIKSIFEKIGKATGAKMPGSKQGSASPSANAGIRTGAAPSVGVAKKFDFNMYLKAVKMFFSDFFGKKVPYFFKNMGHVFKEFPVWWGKQKQDEQISYALVVLGNVMLIIGIVLLIVL
ncbi:hypothetical protein JW898_05955 [Candidatus Woesearchaeota archaeon]|nr:hypothetical protein [Candidatus Woesearchaeota archaeon]